MCFALVCVIVLHFEWLGFLVDFLIGKSKDQPIVLTAEEMLPPESVKPSYFCIVAASTSSPVCQLHGVFWQDLE